MPIDAQPGQSNRRAKIVCTIGPSSSSEAALRDLLAPAWTSHG